MSDSSSSSDSEASSSSPVALGKRKSDSSVPVQAQDDDSDASSDSSRPSSPDVPVVSHAEKRRQKKREEREHKASASSKAKSRSKKADADSSSPSTSPPKRQNSVWVGNLSFKTTPEDLKTFFSGIGGITRIHMPTKAPNGPGMRGENRGFAYVDFSTPEGKAAAIGLSEKPLIGRKLLIKDGDDFTGRPTVPGAQNTSGVPSDASAKPKGGTGLSKTAQQILRVQKQPPAPTLFFGNLGFETTEDSIREFLEAHRPSVKVRKGTRMSGDDDNGALDSKVIGEKKDQTASPQGTSNDPWIRKVRMGTFEDSGLCKGFAFVDFTSIENATAALINPKNHHMDGRKLVVEYASAEAVRRGGGQHGKGPGHGSPSKKSKNAQPSRREQSQSQSETAPRVNGEKKHHREEEHPSQEMAFKKARTDSGEKPTRPLGGKKDRIRPKPGAALALAKRESAAILPSQGKKIVF